MSSDDRLRIVGDTSDVQAELAHARLAPFIAGTQRYLDGELLRRKTRPVPVLPLPGRGRWVALSVAAMAVAAAVAVLWVRPQTSTEQRADAPNLAERAEQTPDSDGEAVVVPPAASRPDARPQVDERTLQSLDAEAQRQWRAGALDHAAAIFVQMTERGGDHRYVELAYGDLVTLARQRGQTRQVQTLWGEYLARFPTGRFATDARAAVCGKPGAPSACSKRSDSPVAPGLGQDPSR